MTRRSAREVSAGPARAAQPRIAERVVEAQQRPPPVAVGDRERRGRRVRVGARLPRAAQPRDRVGRAEAPQAQPWPRGGALGAGEAAQDRRHLVRAPVARHVERDPLDQPRRRAARCRAGEHEVGQLVGDHATALVEAEPGEGGPDDEQPLRDHPGDPLRRALLADGGVRDRRQRLHPADVLGELVGARGRRRDDDEVAAAQVRARERGGEARVAVLQRRRQAGRVDVEARRDEHDEVALVAPGVGRHLPRREATAAERAGDPPAGGRPAQHDPPLGAEGAANAADAPRGDHVRPRAAPVDVEAVDPQLHVAQAQRPGAPAHRHGPPRARRSPRSPRRRAPRRAPARRRGGRAAPGSARDPTARGRRRRAARQSPSGSAAPARGGRRRSRPRRSSAPRARPAARAAAQPRKGAPGSSGASRPASQRSAEAPTSANAPSWRRPS